jgi:arginine kinase
MTKEAKLQVERKAVEVLGDLYGSYVQVKNLKDEDVDWMRQVIGFDPKTTNKEHDAGGINEDWPVGRGVFIQDKKDFLVFVNFEEHLRIVVLLDKTNEHDSLHQGIKRCIKLVQTFEKLGYATDPYLGNLTVSPAKLGTSMSLKCLVKAPASHKLGNDLVQLLTH